MRAFPTLLRVGFAESVAYRAEMLVWVLSTTMPLVMLALWSSVARDAPIGRYGQPEFVAYFLATFIVRQLTGCWIFWEMTFAIRNGTLAMRLLRPVDPLWAYAAEALASMPMRLLVSIPVATIALAVLRLRGITHDPLLWALAVAAISGAWLMTLLVNFIVGCASFFIESSLKLMDLWLVLFFGLSGYLVPIDLFPHRLRLFADWLPFRFQIAFPVELITGARGRHDALVLLGCQWTWVAALFGLTLVAWRRGLRRFAAYGG
jgi:ABC-2 type transport system permease protein